MLPSRGSMPGTVQGEARSPARGQVIMTYGRAGQIMESLAGGSKDAAFTPRTVVKQ